MAAAPDRLKKKVDELSRQLEMIAELQKGGVVALKSLDSAYEGLKKSLESVQGSPKALPLASQREIFRKIHTITGSCRTYGLSFLAKKTHAVEAFLSKLQSDANAWRPARAQKLLLEALTVVEDYRNIQHRFIHVKGESSKNKESKALKECQAIIAKGGDKAAGFDAIARVLTRLSLTSLEEILSGIQASLPSIAQTLGKPSPNVVILGKDALFDEQRATMLEDVFLHCIRNSLDHGIEAPASRGKKPKEGTIKVEVTETSPKLVLRYSDDGAGLNLRALNKKNPDLKTDEEIAELIFQPGLSTKNEVNEISGRGIGMDAVRSFLQDTNATIRVEFTDERTAQGFRPFALVITL